MTCDDLCSYSREDLREDSDDDFCEDLGEDLCEDLCGDLCEDLSMRLLGLVDRSSELPDSSADLGLGPVVWS